MIEPPIRADFGCSRTSARKVTLLPEPDSPSSANVSPLASSRSTPAAARIVFAPTAKSTVSPFTSTIGALIASPQAAASRGWPDRGLARWQAARCPAPSSCGNGSGWAQGGGGGRGMGGEPGGDLDALTLPAGIGGRMASGEARGREPDGREEVVGAADRRPPRQTVNARSEGHGIFDRQPRIERGVAVL